MSEYVPHDVLRINCECCRLPQFIRDRDGAVPRICDACNQHQGQLPDKRLARAESHEAMLRERLTACRASEDRARKDLEASRDQVRSALEGRGRLADRLARAAESERPHGCAAQQLGRESGVIEIARRHRELRDDREG